MTLLEARNRVRDNIGDSIRLSSTATGGTDFTIEDAVKLIQPDDHFKGLNLIITSAGGSAPEGESRVIAKNRAIEKDIDLESPFTAAVESGDSYDIAVFSNDRLNKILERSLRAFSMIAPKKFTESFPVTDGNKRFAPTSAATIVSVSGIEYFNAPTQEHIIYPKVESWQWDSNRKVIEWEYFWTEDKTLTLEGTRLHAFPANDGASFDLDTIHDEPFIALSTAEALYAVVQSNNMTEWGHLSPNVIRREKTSTDWRGVKEFIVQMRQSVLNEIKKDFAGGDGFALSGGIGVSHLNSPTIDKKADPDGKPAHHLFWEVK